MQLSSSCSSALAAVKATNADTPMLQVWRFVLEREMEMNTEDSLPSMWLPLLCDTSQQRGRLTGLAALQVWRFILEREVEAPERFQAIQSYRATMAVLRQQAIFVQQLFDTGVVDEMEKEELLQ